MKGFYAAETNAIKNSTRFKIFSMLCLYYLLSIGLTFYQKWFIKTYKLPLLVVTGHYFLKFIYAFVIRWMYELYNERRVRIPLYIQFKWLIPIGICASLDIGLSIWALEYVTISLYTMAKSSSILFIVAFALFLRLERWRPVLGISASLIVSGLFFFTWKSAQFDVLGLLLIELAAACAGIRWTFSQLVMQQENQTVSRPLDMIVHIQPWMFLAILPLLFIFEGSKLSYRSVLYYDDVFAPYLIILFVVVGSILAFAMEVSEYGLLVNTSGITLNIFGIIKEVFTLLFAYILNGDQLTTINLVGLLLCLSGMLLRAVSSSNYGKYRSSISADLDCHSLLVEGAAT